MRIPKRDVVDDATIHRILAIMSEKGISQQELVEHLGLANGMFTNWKYKGSKTYIRYIDRIAEFLGVSKYYLLQGMEKEISEGAISRFETEVIKMLRGMDEDKRELSYQVIKKYWEETVDTVP